MRRLIPIVLLSAVVAVVSYSLTKELRSEAQSPRRQPFIATVLETRYGVDGKVESTEYSVRAVRSDGSYADLYRRRRPDGVWHVASVVFDSGLKSRVTIEPWTQSVTTYLLPEATAQFLSTAPATCTDDSSAERAAIGGYEVVRTTQQMTLSNGRTVREESWVAPALGCLRLRQSVTVQNGSGTLHRTEREVLFLVEGEPPASLFRVPAEYTERSPSEVMAEQRRRSAGAGCITAACQSGAEKLDEVYRSHQKNR
jgi:hypothetical protein